MNQSISIPDELLSAYIDRQMSEAELRRVEKALSVEPALRRRLETLQATVTVLNHAPTLVAPRAFVLSENQALAAGGRVKGAERTSRWERWLPRLVPVFTAAIAILFVFTLVMPSQKQEVLIETSAFPPTAVKANRATEASAARGMPQAESRGISKAADGQTSPKARSQQGAAEAQPSALAVAQDSTEMQKQDAEKPVAPAVSENEAQVQVVSTATLAEPAPAAPPPASTPWITWLLGLLLALFLFLTWSVFFARSQRK